MSSDVTIVTRCMSRLPAPRLSFGDGFLNAARLGSLARARRSAQQPSPLPPLQTSWRGKGFACGGAGMSRRNRKIAFSKELRQRSTRTEKIAWSMLRAHRCLGLKFRRQYGIFGFIIDFYCFELRLAVEIDGSSHLGRELYDAERQRVIESEGIRFIRITTDEMEECPEILVDRIRAALTEPPSSTHSPLQLAWRGGGGEAIPPNVSPPSPSLLFPRSRRPGGSEPTS